MLCLSAVNIEQSKKQGDRFKIIVCFILVACSGWFVHKHQLIFKGTSLPTKHGLENPSMTHELPPRF